MMGSVHLGRLLHGKHRARATGTAWVVLGAAALAPLPVAAQQQRSVLPTAEILDPSSIRKDADMDFGGIIPTLSGGTVVMIAGASPTCATTGGLIRTGPCKSAAFVGFAIANADLRVMRPSGDR